MLQFSPLTNWHGITFRGPGGELLHGSYINTQQNMTTESYLFSRRILGGRNVEALTSFLTGLCTGTADLTQRLELPETDPCSPAAAALNRFLNLLVASLLSVEDTVHEAGVMEARVRMDLSTLQSAMLRQAEAMQGLAGTVQSVAASASEVAAAAEQGASHAGQLRALAGAGQREVAAAGDQLRALVERSADTRRQVQSLLAQVTGIGQIAGTVSAVASRTNLLSLNAAIEAAHAGEQGRGFAVVAAEIRRLAEQAARSVKEIAAMVGTVTEGIDRTGAAVQGLADASAQAAGASGRAGERLAEMYSLVSDLTTGITQTSETALTQAALAEEMSASSDQVSGEIQKLQHLTAGMGHRQLSTVVERGQAALGRFRYGGRFEWALDFAAAAVREMESAMESAVRDGRVALEDVLDTEYVEVKGPLIARLGRLFDVRRVPAGGFDPPKFCTRGDHAVDQAVIAVIDRRLAEAGGRILSMGVVDVNGFAVAMSSRDCQSWTGDPARDVAGNRIKRIYDDPVGLRAARAGLADADRIPKRAPRSRFAREGVDLDRPAPAGTFLAQTYARDTGAVVTDIAVPIHLLGRRFGALRVGLVVADGPQRT